ncbi:MAG: RNA-binding S4 domain-containing protein [Alistipes sp.]|nr:RNA-binding S4 domain-containing protein [Alistipes sp.]
MAKFNTENSSTLSRFAKDKRVRTERPERGERTQSRPKRASYNPHFTEDNRLRSQYTNQDPERTERSERPARPARPYSSRPAAKPYGKRTEGGSKPYGRGEGGYKGKPRTEGGSKPYSRGEGGYKGKPRTTERRSYPKFDPNKQTGEVRLNRYVAQSGICSRREADELIAAGLVSINGVIVTEMGTKVKPGDEVRFNGEKIQGEKHVYLILNKPKGYVTTIEDDHAAKTVMELVAGACTERIYPVGRLDKNSLGLLLFTNDGDITRTLTHPSLKKKKIYEVTLDQPLTRADFDTLAEGVTLEDGEAYFDEISWLKDDKRSVGVEIHSGKNRIVRRMFEHLGYQVTKLDRVYYAGLTKKNLKRGAWRFLTVDEVNRLKSGRYE